MVNASKERPDQSLEDLQSVAYAVAIRGENGGWKSFLKCAVENAEPVEKVEVNSGRDVANVSENADGNYVDPYLGVRTISERTMLHILEIEVEVKFDVSKVVEDDSSGVGNVDGKTVEANVVEENTTLIYLYGRGVVLTELCVDIF